MNEILMKILIVIGVGWTMAGPIYFGTKMSGPINSLKPTSLVKIFVLSIVSGPFMWLIGSTYLIGYCVICYPLITLGKMFPSIPNTIRKFDNWLEI